MAKINHAIKIIFLWLIKFYRYLLSPLFGSCCRFYPSCSVYAYDAISSFGVIKGCYLAVKRIFCCAPWHPGGFDPVPERDDSCKII